MAAVGRLIRPDRGGGYDALIDRATVLELSTCPRCGAGPGESCQGRRGPRTQLHQERWQAAARHLEGREHEARWWWLIAERTSSCVECGYAIEPEDVIAYRQIGGLSLCEDCVSMRGIAPLVSMAYRERML